MSTKILNPLYTLKNFVVEDSNRFAYKAVVNISGKNALNNCLMLYGDNGVGKTHLIQAAGEIFQKNAQRITYTTVERYLNDLIKYMTKLEMKHFKKKYSKCDVLLIDDLEYLSNKYSMQEELYYTLEKLFNNGKKVILVSKQNPINIPGISDDLKSYFLSALVIKVEAPKRKTVKTIIKKKSDEISIVLDKKTINFIAKNSHKNINTIEGVLLKLKAYILTYNEEISLKKAKKILKDDMLQKKKKRK